MEIFEWEICMQVKKQELELNMEQQTGSKFKRCMSRLYTVSLLIYADYIMWNARLDEAQTGIKIAGRYINNLRCADDTTLMAESEELIELLDESKRGEWKSLLKIQHSENWDHGI